MKRLILMRHAKSSWADMGQTDHDRPLNGRGQKAALKIGHWLNDNGYVPDQIISSTAMRCVETWERLELVLKSNLQPAFDRSLYHAHVGSLLNKLQAARGSTVLMLAHNPTIAAFAEELLAEVPNSNTFFSYPTAATTVIDFDIEDWSKLKLRSGQLQSFVIPGELA